MGFVTIVIAILSVSSAFAEEIDSIILNEDNTSLESYIERAIPNYVYGYEPSYQISYSNIIPYVDFEEDDSIMKCVFVFDGDKVIGRMLINNFDETYGSVYFEQDNAEIQRAFDENLEISIGCYNDNVVFFSEENGYSIIDGVREHMLPPEAPIQMSKIYKANVLPSSSMAYSQNVETQKLLRVSVVSNDSSLGAGTGVCWASCVAMKINYRDKSYLTARDVYYATANKMHGLGIDTDPEGSPSNIIWAYEAYDYNVTYKPSAISCSEILGMLESNIPIQISLAGINEKGEAANHAIIIYGITIANSNSNKADITLWFKDPNYNDNGKKIYFQSSMSTVLTNINYKPGTTTYGMWFATYE